MKPVYHRRFEMTASTHHAHLEYCQTQKKLFMLKKCMSRGELLITFLLEFVLKIYAHYIINMLSVFSLD